MAKKEMEEKLEEIFEFAELSRFRNMKLKNFSSGIYARPANEAAGVPLAMSAGDKFEVRGDGFLKQSHFLRMLKFICLIELMSGASQMPGQP